MIAEKTIVLGKVYGQSEISLTKTMLIEKNADDLDCFVLLKDIKKSVKDGSNRVPIDFVNKDYRCGAWSDRFDIASRRIGCCVFSEKDFKKILAAAKKAR